MTSRKSTSTVSSAPSSSSGFGIKQYFRRSPSQSPPSSKGAKSANRPDLEPQQLSDRLRRQKQTQKQMQRSSVFGSCAQSVGTVSSVLFTVINRSGSFDETNRDNAVVRQAKMLYVSLLESVQKERGEWQGFSASASDPTSNNGPEDAETISPRDLLTTSISAGDKSFGDQVAVLNELLEVSFRNLMGPLVPLELYTQHKKILTRESLAVPPALTTLLAIRGVLDKLEREVRHCLLRLLALWDLIALVSSETQPLLKILADKHHHVFSESSEFESMTARKSERHDTVAVELLQIMVLYRDILFNDIEFILTKQELQINPRLVDEARSKGWPLELEPAAQSEDEDDYYSDEGDISSVSSSDANQLLHDDTALHWSQDAVDLGPPLMMRSRSRGSSSVPSVHEDQVDGEHYYNYDAENEDGEWSIPSPNRYQRTSQRSRTVTPPVSGGAGPLVPVPMLPSSSEGIPPPKKAEFTSPELRFSSGRRRSQQSFSSTPGSPTYSHASSSARSSTRNLSLRTKRRSAPSMNCMGERRRQDKHWHDAASNESRSPPSRSSTRRVNSSRRLRKSKNEPTRRRSTDRGEERKPKNEIQAKPAPPRFLSLAASCFTIPGVATATLCVLATMATIALWGMRNSPRK